MWASAAAGDNDGDGVVMWLMAGLMGWGVPSSEQDKSLVEIKVRLRWRLWGGGLFTGSIPCYLKCNCLDRLDSQPFMCVTYLPTCIQVHTWIH